MNQQPSVGYVILGHGSRAMDSNQDMNRVANSLRERYGFINVQVGNMSLCSPTFSEAIDAVVQRGADTVVVIPYFLHQGVHLRQDIPTLLKQHAARMTGVRLVLGEHLGFDECLVDLVKQRIDHALNMEEDS